MWEFEAAPCWRTRRAFLPPPSQEKNRIKSPKKAGREGESHNSPYFDPVVLCIVTGHLPAVRLRGRTEDSTPGQNKHAQKPIEKKKINYTLCRR